MRASTCVVECGPRPRCWPTSEMSRLPCYAMSALDPDSVGGAIVRQEERRWGGMQHLARRLDEQGELRDDMTVDEAADVLWMLASFEAFDALYTGRGLSTDEVRARARGDGRARRCAASGSRPEAVEHCERLGGELVAGPLHLDVHVAPREHLAARQLQPRDVLGDDRERAARSTARTPVCRCPPNTDLPRTSRSSRSSCRASPARVRRESCASTPTPRARARDGR